MVCCKWGTGRANSQLDAPGCVRDWSTARSRSERAGSSRTSRYARCDKGLDSRACTLLRTKSGSSKSAASKSGTRALCSKPAKVCCKGPKPPPPAVTIDWRTWVWSISKVTKACSAAAGGMVRAVKTTLHVPRQLRSKRSSAWGWRRIGKRWSEAATASTCAWATEAAYSTDRVTAAPNTIKPPRVS
jgi:hypothetical protein